LCRLDFKEERSFDFPISFFFGVVNEIRFAIDSKTKIESDFLNRNMNENKNDCVDSFLATGSAHGPTRQMGT
jgi:hypothetical protein